MVNCGWCLHAAFFRHPYNKSYIFIETTFKCDTFFLYSVYPRIKRTGVPVVSNGIDDKPLALALQQTFFFRFRSFFYIFFSNLRLCILLFVPNRFWCRTAFLPVFSFICSIVLFFLHFEHFFFDFFLQKLVGCFCSFV